MAPHPRASLIFDGVCCGLRACVRACAFHTLTASLVKVVASCSSCTFQLLTISSTVMLLPEHNHEGTRRIKKEGTDMKKKKTVEINMMPGISHSRNRGEYVLYPRADLTVHRVKRRFSRTFERRSTARIRYPPSPTECTHFPHARRTIRRTKLVRISEQGRITETQARTLWQKNYKNASTEPKSKPRSPIMSRSDLH